MDNEELKKHVLSINWDKVSSPRAWFDNNLVLSYCLSSFFVGVPVAESCCVKSLQSVKDYIKSPRLKEQYQSFIDEECAHSLVHKKFNRYLEKFGYPIQSYEKFYSRLFRWLGKKYSPKNKAAIALAIEHYSTTIGMAGIDLGLARFGESKIYDFMYWHCLEEVAHKEYLFEVYHDIGGGYFRRITVFTIVSFLMLPIFGLNILLRFIAFDLLRDQGPSFRELKQALVFFFKKPGFFWFFSKRLLALYKPSYKP